MFEAKRFPLALALATAAATAALGACDGPDPSLLTHRQNATPPTPLVWPARYDGTPSGFRRLTRDELTTTMQALTGQAPSRDDLPAEPRRSHEPLLTGGVPFIASEVDKLAPVITSFSTRIAPSMLERSSCKSTGQAQLDCLHAWAMKFGREALRRPLTDNEGALFSAILAGADGNPSNDAAAVAAVLGAVFFSPSFLYRTEIGTPTANNPDVRQLRGDELATRLAYFATLGPPDAELLQAAAAGQLSDVAARLAHFDRLAASDAGRRAQAVLVLEWLGANEPTFATKSAKYKAGLDVSYESAIRSSVENAVRSVLTSATPTVATLLSTEGYMNDPVLQAVTTTTESAAGTTGDDAATRRGGLLMHPHVIAAHTKEDGASPFQLGVFMREALLCEKLDLAPANAAAMAKTDIPPGASLREEFEYRISGGSACVGCHAQFAPLGYSFLPFDPVGRWLKQDRSGKPWDLSGQTSTWAGVNVTFNSPRTLVETLGASPQVHGCFAQASLEWALGRHLVKQDEAVVAAINEVVVRTHGDVVAILRAIVAAPEFSTSVAGR